MSVLSKRSVTITFSGDIVATEVFSGANNGSSPAQIELKNLSSGANTITPPTGSTAVTIIPPSDNAVAITLKGVTGDTGVKLHEIDPTILALDPSLPTFVLTAGAAITGLRLIWS